MNVLVTGATGNVGKAVVAHAKKLNWHATRVSRRGDDGAIGVNLSSWPVADFLCRKVPQVDLVVMAHGVQVPTEIIDVTETQWKTIIDTNLMSCVALTQALLKNEKLNEGALIVYCSSIQAFTPRRGRGLYAIAKSGLEALCRTAAVELAPEVRAVALRLGQLTKTMGGVEFSQEERERLEIRAMLPWVAPDDVAKLCFNLYEQKSLTGCVIDLDSGHGRNVW